MADYLTVADLETYGITPEHARRCLWAFEYFGLDAGPCWAPEDLEELLAQRGGAE
jgi:hypothetical protein